MSDDAWRTPMHPILVQHLATQRMDSLDREADRRRLAGIARPAGRDRAGRLERLSRTAGRLRLAVQHAAA